MGKNVILNNVTYSNVSAVQLLKTDGNFAKFIDQDAITAEKLINYASGEITPETNLNYIDIEDLAFSPRIFVIAAINPGTAPATNGVIVIGDRAHWIRSATNGTPSADPTISGTINGRGLSMSNYFTCSTLDDFTSTTPSTAQRTPSSIRVCKSSGSPSFPFTAGQLYKWFAFGWED